MRLYGNLALNYGQGCFYNYLQQTETAVEEKKNALFIFYWSFQLHDPFFTSRLLFRLMNFLLCIYSEEDDYDDIEAYYTDDGKFCFFFISSLSLTMFEEMLLFFSAIYEETF